MTRLLKGKVEQKGVGGEGENGRGRGHTGAEAHGLEKLQVRKVLTSSERW